MFATFFAKSTCQILLCFRSRRMKAGKLETCCCDEFMLFMVRPGFCSDRKFENGTRDSEICPRNQVLFGTDCLRNHGASSSESSKTIQKLSPCRVECQEESGRKMMKRPQTVLDKKPSNYWGWAICCCILWRFMCRPGRWSAHWWDACHRSWFDESAECDGPDRSVPYFKTLEAPRISSFAMAFDMVWWCLMWILHDIATYCNICRYLAANVLSVLQLLVLQGMSRERASCRTLIRNTGETWAPRND